MAHLRMRTLPGVTDLEPLPRRARSCMRERRCRLRRSKQMAKAVRDHHVTERGACAPREAS